MNNYITRVGVSTLNQFAMDFEHNLKNIIESIQQCKAQNCLLRTGPELEIPGYMCEDHFLELDTVNHSWEVLSEILDYTDGILCDIGMPVMHKNVLYNCRVVCYDRKIHLIRPKIFLADEGNYRESRWFTPWEKKNEEFQIPDIIYKKTGQRTAPIGVAIIKTLDTEIGFEICQELWQPIPTSSAQLLDGAEIIINSSGSHFEIGKIGRRVDMFKDITRRNGAVYIYSNMRGCDGNRIYFDGSSSITLNGKLFARSTAFSLQDAELTICDIDLQEVKNFRINLRGRSMQATQQSSFPRVEINVNLTNQSKFILYKDLPIKHEDDEVTESVSCFLWDYLRRSGAMGFVLPLSGGLDSCSSAICVFHLANKILQYKHVVLGELRRIVQDPNFDPQTPQEIVKKIFYTVYLGTKNSSADSRRRSKNLAQQINSNHFEINIDTVSQAFQDAIRPVFDQEPRFEAYGGTYTEDLALQNIQARSRMAMTYFLAQLLPWKNNQKSFLLVLGSSNLDESLRGYYTKYDCSSADLNPIGSLTKNDLKRMLIYTYQKFGFEAIKDILTAKPSAELRPNSNQISEEEMGLTFDELEIFGKLRKVQNLGPYSMFRKLINIWQHVEIKEVANKVKRFFTYYAQNRHKVTTLPPAFHAESHSNDDNRFDFRQIIYNIKWPWQFRKIDELSQQ